VDERPPPGSAPGFEALTRRGSEAVQSGRLAEAAHCYEEALAWARAHEDPATVDRAFCNRATLAIEEGEGDAYLGELRRVLVRSRGRANGFRAAYGIARAHELRRELDKAAFYAGIALDHARRLRHAEWEAWAQHLLGVLELEASRFANAAKHFQRALRRAPADMPAVWRALAKDNLGYCHFIRGRRRPGLALFYESLRAIRRAGASRFEVYPHISLCFAHLELGRLTTALRHGTRALSLARDAGDREARKMSLYLLGETTKRRGMVRRAHAYFEALQREFYPDNAHLPSLLLAVDVLRMVNLKG
jgi:tetratricopeptide (TPR) repeat protein